MKFFLLKKEPLVPVLTPSFFQGPSSVGLNPKFSNFKPFDDSLGTFFQIQEPLGRVQKLGLVSCTHDIHSPMLRII
jgi:hypothetical protein